MVRLEEYKHSTQDQPIERMPAPDKAYIPLSQHLGKACGPEVGIGDVVLTGQIIGSAEAHVFAPIHSSVSGKVISIQPWPHHLLGRCETIVIENDKLNRLVVPQASRPEEEIDKLSAQELRKIVFAAGVVGMGGASFPTHIKLEPPKPIDALIINGAECEPYLNSDNRLMIEHAKEIVAGIGLVKKCTGAKNVYIAIEENKPEAIKAMGQEGAGAQEYKLKILKSEYPQGGEKQLIKNILKREVPSGKLPFDIAVVVHNVATVYAIYEAVYLNKPLYERVVTVTGSCLARPKNLLVRIGTTIKELIDYCAPLKEEPAKIIIGGPMMGVAQYSLCAPVIKSTNGVVLLSKKETRALEEEFCIRCGACVRACPAGLMPCLLNLAAEKSLWQQTKAYNVLDCIECGLCNYVCPANRRITQSIKRAKLEVAK